MIIGLSGYARAGKDTVGAILVERHGFTRVSFADGLRELAMIVNPKIDLGDPNDFDHEEPLHARLSDAVELGGWDGAKQYDDVRRLLQALGTGARQVLGEHCWVERVERILDGRPGGPVVITDVRFPNEARMVTERDGAVIRVRRPGTGPVNTHISETAMDDWRFDYTIDNDGTLEDLAAHVALVLEDLAYVGAA